MKWIRLIIAAGICLLFLLSGKELSTGDCEEKIVRYVALGDSIAGGYGLKDVQNDSYVALCVEFWGKWIKEQRIVSAPYRFFQSAL